MNFFESLLSAEFIRAFAWTLFHSLWQGGLVALMAAGLMILLRKHKPGIRYLILYTLLLLLPVFFVVTLLMTYDPDRTSNINYTETVNINRTDIAGADDLLAFTQTEAKQSWYIYPVHLFENQAKWLVLLWFTGFLIFLLRFSGSIIYVYRLKNHQVYLVDEQWNTNLRRLSDRIGLDHPVRLAESALARIPMTIGYLKPVILLPLGTLSGVPPQQIDAILLHELGHIFRKDYMLNIIQSLIEMLFFYHPVTWWLSTMIRQEREHICDDLAIGVNNDHINYIKALTTMEELNSRSPLLVNAMTSSKKKLLLRVKRLLTPVKLRKGLGEGIIALILLGSLIFTLSLNALSFIPSAFDLTGRETGERLFNFLPINPNGLSEAAMYQPIAAMPVNNDNPDTVITTSRSGKVIVKVYTDSTGVGDEKDIEVFVETLDKNIGEWEQAKKDYEKQVIILKKNAGQPDSIRKVIVIKSGDSIKDIKSDTMLWIPEDFDTSIVTGGGFQFYGFDMPEIPEMPEMPEMQDLKYYYFNEDPVKRSEQHDKALREYEFKMRDFERDHRLMEKELQDMRVIVSPPDAPEAWQWTPAPPAPPLRNSEKIIRQELRDDGLVFPYKGYIIEIDSKAMYINGERQSKEIYRKYKRLAEGLDNLSLDDDGAYRIIF